MELDCPKRLICDKTQPTNQPINVTGTDLRELKCNGNKGVVEALQMSVTGASSSDTIVISRKPLLVAEGSYPSTRDPVSVFLFPSTMLFSR